VQNKLELKSNRFDSQVPEIQVRREGMYLIFVNHCPYCGRRHYHGARGGAGHRAAHCPGPARGMEKGYILILE
jgi:hypothetical protein